MSDTHKGKLTIFTSYTPGAGKSYAMLSHALKNPNVVIGFLNETHRDIGKLLEDHNIESKDYSHYSLGEIILKKPALVVMDEMGMRGKNRDRKSYIYGDIDRLLNAGIDVYASVNIKKFEGTNLLFREVTGIGVKRCVPDEFLESASKIYFIDRSPEDMLKDFEETKLFDDKYRKSKIMQKNFKIETLRAYRDISLKILERYQGKTEIETR